MLLQAFQPYKLSILTSQLCLAQKSYPQIWCHTPTLSLEISEILNIFYFSQLSATTWKFYMNHIVKGGYI